MKICWLAILVIAILGIPMVCQGQIDNVPGATIFYSRNSDGIYLGSPGIVILPNGDYLAKYDEYGPKSTFETSAVTHVFVSEDRGETWSHRARVQGLFWSTLFLHNDDLYMLGTHKRFGDIVIFCSQDGGETWTTPKDHKSGLLKNDAQYHTAPVPILIHKGRIWRPMERLGVRDKWGTFEAGMMSAAVDADLLDAESWCYTNFLPVPKGSPVKHWLEGNPALTPDGKVVNILRTGHKGPMEKAVLLEVSDDGKSISFDEQTGLIDMPGAGDKKFTIRYDEQTKRYWSLVNPMLPAHTQDKPASIRNALAIVSSDDLRNWQMHKVLLYHLDTKKHAFQYPDWVYDGKDIIAAIRMAHDDQCDGTHWHNANYFSFYRISNFRDLQKEEPEMKYCQTRWTTGKAWEWYNRHSWLVGCNFTPSTAINQLEMWQKDTFDPETIDRELGWAHDIGMNFMRVFLHDLLWQQDSKGFIERIDKYLEIADKHQIKTMFVFFDSCWNPYPELGRQPEPTPHLHNSGWVQSPSLNILKDLSRHDELKDYIVGILTRFKDDPRVLTWDLYNEPGNRSPDSYGHLQPKNKAEMSLALLQKVFQWSRQVNPSQPLTTCAWCWDWEKGKCASPILQCIFENSDINTFHSYLPPEEAQAQALQLQEYGRPVICTEFLIRTRGQTFLTMLPFFKEHNMGACNWGFVAGKTQTNYPWDSWQVTYTEEPDPWFHDLLYRDGTYYRPEEIKLLQKMRKEMKSKKKPISQIENVGEKPLNATLVKVRTL